MSEQIKGSTFEELYLEQRKKSSMLVVAVVVLAITTVGGLAWGFSNNGSGTSNQTANTSQFPGGDFNGQNGPGSMQGGMNMDVKQFFNDDGSVKTSEVESFLGRMPSGGNSSNSGFNFLDRFKEMINQAADNGEITQDQAQALIQAFESGDSV